MVGWERNRSSAVRVMLLVATMDRKVSTSASVMGNLLGTYIIPFIY